MSERDNPRGLDSLRLLSNEELARAAAGGDESAARVLLERFEEPLYRYTVALVRDPDLAREATWSALFEAARAVRADEYSDPIAPWIFRVAHTAADVAFGRPEGAPAHDEAAAIAAASDPADRDRLERLLEGLDSVPDRDRSSLLLRELVGLEYVGIATVTGARAAAARQSVYRARQTLLGHEPATPHCPEIQAAMSKAETGLRERRSIALHLETCPVCAEFAAELEQRPRDLKTLFPAPAEPLAAELVPPLPPLPSPSARPRRRRVGGAVARRRRGALVPLVLGLLLVGAAVATALALNDNGGGEHGRANAAGGGAKQGAGTPKRKPHVAAKPKPAQPKPKPAKPRNPKPAAAAKRKSSKAKGGAAGGGAAANGGGGAKAANGGGKPGSSSGGGKPAGATGGGKPGGANGAHAAKRRPCRADPVAAPAQSGYGNSAGVAQVRIHDPCARAREAGGGGLAATGLDVALVFATGALMLAFGTSLRRLGSSTD